MIRPIGSMRIERKDTRRDGSKDDIGRRARKKYVVVALGSSGQNWEVRGSLNSCGC